jgi:hypothetical protein
MRCKSMCPHQGDVFQFSKTQHFCRNGGIVIRKLPNGQYRLYSRKVDEKTGRRRNLGTFDTRTAAEKHEREVQYFKRH